MPLPFDLASLITNYTAPASSRVDPLTLQRMQFEQGKKNDAFDQERSRFYMKQSQDNIDYNRDDDVWNRFRDAVLSGDQEAIQLSKGEVEKRGFKIDLPPQGVARATGAATTTRESDSLGSSMGMPPGPGAQGAPEAERAAEDQFLSDAAKEPGVPASPEKDLPVPSMADEIGGQMGLPPMGQKQEANKFRIRDREGRVMFEADPKQIIAARQQRVGEVFDSYIEQAGDEEEKSAATAAKGIAQKALASGYSMKEAVALGIQEYNKQVDPYRKAFIGTEVAKARGKYRYGDGSGGGGGPASSMGGGLEISTGASRLADDEDKWITKAYNSEGLKPGVIDAAANLDLALDAAKSNEGMSQMSAVRGFIASISGKVVTNAEAADYFQSTGLVNELIRLKERTFGEGELPQELMKQLTSVLLRAKRGIFERKQRAAGRAANYAMTNPNFGEPSARRMAEWIGFPLESVWKPGMFGGGGQKPAAKPAAPAAPGGKTKSAEELAR